MGDKTFADFNRPSQTSSVANELMKEWEEEVAALKFSKRQKWKGSMRNQSRKIRSRPHNDKKERYVN